MAFDLKMDRLSLQLLAILNLARFAPRKARLLWGEMPQPALAPLKCEDALIYDITDYHRALVEMAEKAFTDEELKIGEQIKLVDSYIVNISSPAEVTGAAVAITDLKITPFQFNLLVETYSRALENVANDNRSFWSNADLDCAAAIALAGECERRGFPADFLLNRFRNYVAGQLSAPRCADNLTSDGKRARQPKFVTDLNAALDRYESIRKITYYENPRRIDRPAQFYPYWTTPRARSLFQKIHALGYSMIPQQTTTEKPRRTPNPLSFEERQSSEWQYRLSDILREMAEWKPEHEASTADYIHQKCHLFNELLELSPNSDMRLRILDEYMAFLEQNRFECESFIDWYLHVSDLLRRIRSMKEEEKRLSLEALRYSNDQVLQLCVKLMPVFEAALQASR
jgi:hypothetical protein